MKGYLIFIDLLTYLFIAVMARHLWKRARFHLHIFQQSGYKLKAYRSWIWNNWGTHVMPVKHGLYNLIILGLLLLSFYGISITETAITVTLSIFGFFWFIPANFYGGEKPKKPLAFTPRLIRLMIPYLLMCSVVPVYGTYLSHSMTVLLPNMFVLTFGWILGDILAPLFIFPAAILLSPLETHIHNRFKKMAREKVRSMKNLTVIALTGSYGKTTTKFILRDLLQERFNVLATPGSYNTPMGICKVINNDLQSIHQILILEMGARHKGNIKELCQIAQPDITIVTTVGVAHLETFGSRAAIAETKQEIVENMKSGGFSVLNADNDYASKMDIRDDVTFIKTGIEHGEVKASDVQYGQEGCSFEVSFADNPGNEKQEQNGEHILNIKMPLLGAHNVYNMLFAVTVAKKLGLRDKTIELAAQKIQQVEHRLELKKRGDIYVIDDAFNSNPVGAKNAVEILSTFKTGRKIIITPGMIELGDIQDKENRKFGQTIAKADLDLIILVGEQQTKPILEGYKSVKADSPNVKIVQSLYEANDLLGSFAKPGDVVLYENDLPDTYNE